jgi:hypothetical protein
LFFESIGRADFPEPLGDLPPRGVAEQRGGTASAVPSASLIPLATRRRGFVTKGRSIFEKSWVGEETRGISEPIDGSWVPRPPLPHPASEKSSPV